MPPPGLRMPGYSSSDVYLYYNFILIAGYFVRDALFVAVCLWRRVFASLDSLLTSNGGEQRITLAIDL